MKNSQHKVQISDSHRLVNFVQNLPRSPDKIRRSGIDVEYFLSNVIKKA